MMNNISDFEKTVGITYKDAVKYLKSIDKWERNKQYSGYEIVMIAKSYKEQKE